MPNTAYAHVEQIVSDLVYEIGAKEEDTVLANSDKIEIRLSGTTDRTLLRMRKVLGQLTGTKNLLRDASGGWDYQQFHDALVAHQLTPADFTAPTTGRALPKGAEFHLGNLTLSIEPKHVALTIEHGLKPEALMDAFDPILTVGSVQCEGQAGAASFREFTKLMRPTRGDRGH